VRPADGTTPAGTLPVGARRTGTTAAGARRTGTTAAGARHTGTTPAGACGGEPAPELAEVVARLRRAMRRAARAQHGGLPAGLSVAQLELLGCLAEHPGARPGELARMLRLAPSSVATLIAGLRQAGLISRTGGAADRRTAQLRLSPAGAAAVTGWQRINARILASALGTLSPARRARLAAALPALAELAGAVDTLAAEK
jgi:DNA-binding MarR family transcriptional regulator